MIELLAGAMCIDTFHPKSLAKWLLSCLRTRWLKRLPQPSWANRALNSLLRKLVEHLSQYLLLSQGCCSLLVPTTTFKTWCRQLLLSPCMSHEQPESTAGSLRPAVVLEYHTWHNKLILFHFGKCYNLHFQRNAIDQWSLHFCRSSTNPFENPKKSTSECTHT